MDMVISLDGVYVPSDDVVAREIEGEVIIVPLVSGIGDTDDELFTLNETGQAIWSLLNGVRTLEDIARELSKEYDGEGIAQDVVGFVGELLKRRILIAATQRGDAGPFRS